MKRIPLIFCSFLAGALVLLLVGASGVNSVTRFPDYAAGTQLVTAAIGYGTFTNGLENWGTVKSATTYSTNLFVPAIAQYNLAVATAGGQITADNFARVYPGPVLTMGYPLDSAPWQAGRTLLLVNTTNRGFPEDTPFSICTNEVQLFTVRAGGVVYVANGVEVTRYIRSDTNYMVRANASDAIITNSLTIGLNGAAVTNILAASATLDFASQTVGAREDLPITVTGAASGDVVSVGVPQASATAIIGTFTGFASNNAVYVRFVSTGTAQDPASGTFKVTVTKF